MMPVWMKFNNILNIFHQLITHLVIVSISSKFAKGRKDVSIQFIAEPPSPVFRIPGKHRVSSRADLLSFHFVFGEAMKFAL